MSRPDRAPSSAAQLLSLEASPPDGHRPAPAGAPTSNPLRIVRIGADHVQVLIRPAQGGTELRALVDRLEQLVDAGYATIDVAFESVRRETNELTRPAPSAAAEAPVDLATR